MCFLAIEVGLLRKQKNEIENQIQSSLLTSDPRSLCIL